METTDLFLSLCALAGITAPAHRMRSARFPLIRFNPVSAEGQDVASITYQGVALSQAFAGTGRNSGIFYLDNPFTGGAADLLVTFSPKDNAFYVALNANLVLTFSETIQKGNGNITIRRADGAVFETINVNTAAVTPAGGKVTINPANNFVAGNGYDVLIDPTALRNAARQYYAGISDPTVWNFTALPDLATVDGRLTWMMQQNITNLYMRQ
jgi:hypothetical protein